MRFKKYLASIVSCCLLLSLFANVPLTFAALNDPELLKDINLETEDSDVDEFAVLGGNIYMTPDEFTGIYYVALSDLGGVPTKLEGDYDYVYNLTVLGDKLLFTANSTMHGEELWVSNGTTASLLADINSAEGNSSYPDDFYIYDGLMYFSAYTAELGRELYVTDGTAEGTELVADILEGTGYSNPEEFFELNGELYFFADISEDTPAIFKLDSEGGVIHVAGINYNDYEGWYTPEYDDVNVIGNTAYFLATVPDQTHGFAVYSFAANTITRLFDFDGNDYIYDLEVSNGILFFDSESGLEYDNGEGRSYYYDNVGEAIWYYDPVNGPVWGESDEMSDFTNVVGENQLGAVRPEFLYDPNPEGEYADISNMEPFLNGVLYRAENLGYGDEPYFSNLLNTTMLADVYSGFSGSNPDEADSNFFVNGNTAYFFADTTIEDDTVYDTLWVTDGTAEGTELVSDNDPYYSGEEAEIINGVVYIGAYEFEMYGDEPIAVTNTEGTFSVDLVADLNTFSKSSSCGECNSEYYVYNDTTAYFIADDGIHGDELWVTDGTEEGTELFYDIEEGPYSGSPRKISRYENYLVSGYNINNENLVGYINVNDVESGFTNLKYLNDDLTSVSEIKFIGSKLFISAYHFTVGSELFMIDFSAETLEVSLVKDIFVGTDSSELSWFTDFDNKLFFAATDGENGYEIWSSDGTEEGTNLFTDIYVGTSSSYPNDLTVSGDLLYFSAEEGSYGRELYVTDGTESGAIRITDINEAGNSSSPSYLTPYGTNQLLFEAYSGSYGLYLTSGVLDDAIRLNSGEGSVYDIGVLSDHIVVSMYSDDYGYELWSGTAEESSLTLISDIYEGNQGSHPNNFLVASNGLLYFSAEDEVLGRELYVTDGTAEGTVLVEDIHSTEGSAPYDLAQMGEYILFRAQDATTDSEPYVMQIGEQEEQEEEQEEEPTPSTPRNSGGSSGSRASTTAPTSENSVEAGESSSKMTYQQEVARVLEKQVVTENPDSTTNKCEALVMMQRVFEWQVPKAMATKYNDVPEWCTDVAAFGTERGIVEGRAVDRLGMETPVTRDEVALMLFRELKLQNYTYTGTQAINFLDAPLTPWASEAILTLAKESIIKGFADGTFGGQKNILKQDLGVMLLRVKDKMSN